ncbi:MAG: lamin tail domain-containing protein, partial [Verrucomicrobia bacterium]
MAHPKRRGRLHFRPRRGAVWGGFRPALLGGWLAWAWIGSAQPAVRLTEIMYHPAGADPAEPGEYLELYNAGSEAVDLAGWRFDRGIDFVFPEGTILEPRGFLLVAKDPAHL